MLDQQTTSMFARIAQTEPRFKEWLQAELSDVHDTLVQNAHEAQFRQAQGRAQQLRKLVTMLDTAARRG